ncbi:MAG: AI-2E family transporter [Spirochaetes bacterium GWD1_61_31]|nr:MAG: AI-2E family transporter [Spirochaetes bacterium GWB1_60_80]OHD35618.1 MAG: AI-2E family transporter [Spirochaetes bacterium GWD1_61_31]OHD41656.1 MAG: AI-2E family transporter [Spirochaetes bacterium GWE1_60_18]OHD61683.1 MAG: AI-2E family transporter [Spirochaetes bacterium GWF1_60_12]HAP42898.1 AI-2E family transporter [Spirochaetaceae bacterium]
MTEPGKRNANFVRANLFLLGVVALIMVGATLKLTASVLLPFIIAVLLTFILEPLIHFLGKLRIPRTLAVLVTVLFVGLVVYVIGLILYTSISTIAVSYPRYESRFTEIYILIAKAFDLPYNEQLNLFQNLWQQLNIRANIQSLAIDFSQNFLGLLSDTMMVVLFMVFLLLEMSHLKDRAELAFANAFPGGIKHMIEAIVLQISRYLSIKFVLSLATGLLIGIGLWLLGMDFPLVWGVICFLLNFIPTLGSIVAGGGVVVFAVVQFYPNPVPIIIASIIVLGANQIIGNLLEPKIQGDNLGLSPIVILLSLLVWGWLWGFAGLLLAVPMTVIVKIICEQVPALEPVSIMMGSYKAAVLKEGKAGGEASGQQAAEKGKDGQQQ